jgi:hypothetical protein
MPTTDAVLALREFCIDRLTAFYCRDEDARRILQYALGERVNAVVDRKYVFQISILVATQVYVTDQFDIRRSNIDGLQASFGEPAGLKPGSKPDHQSADPAVAHEPDNQVGAAKSVPQAEGNAANGSYHDEQKSSQELKRTFDRPVAFGFKSVAFALPPSRTMEH